MADSDSEVNFNINNQNEEEAGGTAQSLEPQEQPPSPASVMNAEESDTDDDVPHLYEPQAQPRQRPAMREQPAVPQNRNHSNRSNIRYLDLPVNQPGHYEGQQPKNGHLTIKPQCFSGEEDWEVYLRHFEVCAELGQWTDRERALALLASLRGEAQNFSMTIHSAERERYSDIVYHLSQRFGKARQQPMWMTRFEARLKGPNEPLLSLEMICVV
ncbi:uncharacterized protein LOC128556677 [Mercenaria mercenaria]|uniref:uncharacterized protein LOC128556677 n=1 Tax=Mercenaria mercenaria TaxID=6596 RepID=UPI00234F24EE|nr:uncharacterized protein LOC128556677 [Mercenaria mercenaria]